jgi:CHAT domain-containing protein
MDLQRGDPATGKLGGWLEAYSYRRSARENWVRAIDAIGAILHDEIWAPVLAQLAAMGVARGAELLWFPQGGSGVFPMHAAWRAIDGRRHWLVDDYAIRYAPSLHALRRKPPRGLIAHALVVANPVGDLPFCDLECAWILQGLAGTKVSALSGAQATREAVVGSLPQCDIVHFATHAAFNLVNPFDSSITLAMGEALTLQQMLPLLQDRAPSFVALSACESGMARVTAMPDESLGFPAALLERGARTVLATLWPVDDAATSLLMQRFYREFGRGSATAAGALRQAQAWLRTVTVSEVSKLLGDLRREAPSVGPVAARLRTRMFALEESQCLFAEPYFWAAFTVSGE